MSADPSMLWRFKENVNILSFSDMHSFWPWRIGRESTVFDCELTYKSIIKAIRTGDGIKKTIETDPPYGKYHYDGHRNCDFSCNFEESKKLNGICPKCKKQLTIGVEYRIEELAKEPNGYKPENKKDFVKLIPLHELISAVYNIQQLSSKKVWEIYNLLIKNFENEFNVLLNSSYQELTKVINEKLANVIIQNREGKLRLKPGYDGVYGEILLENYEKIISQKSLTEF